MRIYILLLSALLLSACSSDLPDETSADGAPITIRLRLRSNNNHTYAWNQEKGNDADEDRLQSAFAVMLNDKCVVEHILVSRNSQQNLEEDFLVLADGNEFDGTDRVPTTIGKKHFYTFANLTPKEVEAATGLHFFVGQTVDTAIVNHSAISFSGDGFTPSRTKGIPMTGNYRTDLFKKDHNGVRDLYVVRLLAKLQFSITNNTGKELTVNTLSVDGLTQNPTAGEKNLYIFASPYTPAGMPVTLYPHLTSQATSGIRTYPVNQTLSNGSKTEFTAYVNESQTPKNPFSQFMLTLKLTKTDGTKTEQRYALVSNDNKEWDYIARNDWRVIPIVLQDYKFELIPRDFPPIGVLPCSVKGDEGTFTCTFYADGSFHLEPRLSLFSTGAVVTDWTRSDVTWETTQEPPSLYLTPPLWHELGGYVHGCFVDGSIGVSRHVLTLTAKPNGGVARRVSCPVILEKKK